MQTPNFALLFSMDFIVLGAFKRLRTLATISFCNSCGHIGGDGFAAGGDLEGTGSGGGDDDESGASEGCGGGGFAGLEREGGGGELTAAIVGIITKTNSTDIINMAWNLPILMMVID